MTRPDELVDPTDAAEVAPVVLSVALSMGPSGVVDLLGRFPGAVVQAAQPKRFLSAGSPEQVWLGPEDCLAVVGTVLEYRQVVGGVVLHRESLTPAQLPARIAGLVDRYVQAQGCVDEAAVALTAARDAVGGF